MTARTVYWGKSIFYILLIPVMLAAKPLMLVMESDSILADSDHSAKVLLQEQLSYFQNNGYPFSQWILEKFTEDDTHFTARYRLSRGENTVIDTVIFGEYSQRDVRHIQKIINDSLTGIFSQKRIAASERLINQSRYLTMGEIIELDDSTLILNVKNTNPTRFDALLSYKKNGSDPGAAVGELNIQLNNILGLGRQIIFNWYRPTLSANRINIHVRERFFMGSPFSLGAAFNQNFRDSLYVSRRVEADLSYEWNPHHYLSYAVSRNNVSTTEKGRDLGYEDIQQLENRFGWTWDTGSAHFRWTNNFNLTFVNDDTSYGLGYNLHEKFAWSLNNRSIVLGLFYEKIPANQSGDEWEQVKLGGPAFLRGSDLEEFSVDEVLGSTLSFDVRNGLSGYSIFVDIAAFHDHTPFIQPGIVLTIPAGKSQLSIILGFDIHQSWQQGKFHLLWTM